MEAKIIQHAVGQGGLLSGEVKCEGEPLRWVYDCGSNQLDSLRRETIRVAQNKHLDILFLSHLDSDHVNGIEQLLKLAEGVGEVVLPYLSPTDITLAICRDIEAGALAETFLDFASDPAGWLISRGVLTVTFLGSQEDSDTSSTDGPDDPRARPDAAPGKIGYRWSRDPSKRKAKGAEKVQRMDVGATIYASAETPVSNWVLAPYAHKPSIQRARQFVQELRAAFGGHQTVGQIALQARTAAGRAILRRCYGALWADHNIVSMSLYAGPEWAPTAHAEVQYFAHPFHPMRWWNSLEACGWLSTGDASLGVQRRRTAFLKYYRRYLEYVGVLVVPHHGAATSFHNELISELPNISFGLAAVGKNGYGHPHKMVRDAFNMNGVDFFNVNEDPSTNFQMASKW